MIASDDAATLAMAFGLAALWTAAFIIGFILTAGRR